MKAWKIRNIFFGNEDMPLSGVVARGIVDVVCFGVKCENEIEREFASLFLAAFHAARLAFLSVDSFMNYEK